MSNQNKPVSVEKAKVFPTNARTNYSFKNGNPQITFNIQGDNQRLLDPTTLRLNFTLRIQTSAGVRPNNQNTAVGAPDACFIDNRVGVNSVIDVLRLRGQDSGEVIEEVRNYSRLLATVIPSMSSLSSYKNWVSNKHKAFAREDTQGLLCNGDMPCSISLRCGLFNSGQPLNLADLGGMVIDLMLAPDSFVLYDNNNGTTASTFSYQLSDVNLTYNWLVMERPFNPSNEMLQYPAFASFTNIVQSSDDQQALLLGLQSVRNTFSNSIPSASINNFAFNSLDTPRLQESNNAVNPTYTDKKVLEYTHMRNNVKFNKSYSVDERLTVADGTYEAHKNREFLDCIRPFRSIVSCLQSPATQGTKTSLPVGTQNIPQNKYVGGIGCNYDTTNSGAGVPFKDAQYALRIASQLNNTPNTLFTFSLSNQGLAVKSQQVQPVM